MSKTTILHGKASTIYVSLPSGTPGALAVVDAQAFAPGGTPQAVTATPDTTDTTTTAPIVAGDNVIATAAPLVAGKHYAIVDGAKARVFRAATPSTSAADFDDAFPVGARVVGHSIAIAMPSAASTNTGWGTVIVEYTADGDPRKIVHPFEVRAHSVGYSLTVDKLLRLYPALANLLHPDTTWDDLIASAWDDDVVEHLRAAGIDADDLKRGVAIEGAHASAVFARAVETDPAFDEDYSRRARARFEGKIKRVIAARKYDLDKSEKTAAADEGTTVGIALRVTR